MNINVQKLPNARVKLDIEVPAKGIEKYFQNAYKKLSGEVEIEGFRKGHAPKIMVIDKIGQARFNSEALNLALPEIYMQAVKEKNIIPISQPAVSIKQFTEGKQFIFTLEVDIVPKIELGDYRKLKIKYQKPKIEAKDEEVEKVLKRLRYQSAQYNEKNAPCEKNDRIEIEFEGMVKGVKQDKYCSKNYPLILGEKILLPGFEEKLIGMKKGEEKEFKLKVKDDEVDFKTKMLDVKKVDLPLLNDQFAAKFGRSTLLDLKGAIGQGIVKEKEMHARQELEKKIFEELLKLAKMEVPESLVNQEIARKIQQLQAQSGPGFSEFLKKSGKSMADLQKDLRPDAERSVKIGLILGEVSRDLGFVKVRPKTEEEQRAIVKKTMDKLIEFATK